MNDKQLAKTLKRIARYNVSNKEDLWPAIQAELTDNEPTPSTRLRNRLTPAFSLWWAAPATILIVIVLAVVVMGRGMTPDDIVSASSTDPTQEVNIDDEDHEHPFTLADVTLTTSDIQFVMNWPYDGGVIYTLTYTNGDPFELGSFEVVDDDPTDEQQTIIFTHNEDLTVGDAFDLVITVDVKYESIDGSIFEHGQFQAAWPVVVEPTE